MTEELHERVLDENDLGPELFKGGRDFSRGEPLTFREYLSMTGVDPEKMLEFAEVLVTYTDGKRRFLDEIGMDHHFQTARSIEYSSLDGSITGTINIKGG